MAERAREVPPPRTVWLVVVAPIAAVVLCGLWSYVAWHLTPVERAVENADARREAIFWATDLPMWLFGLPAAVVGAWAFFQAIRTRQGWLCVLMVLYYSPLLVIALLACMLFTPFKPFG